MNNASRTRQVSKNARAVRRRSYPLWLEPLEQRCLLDASFSLIDETNNHSDGVSGTAGTDLLRLSPAA
ncbi:MAG TPA: hypothetical protein VEL76_33635, partial [Gemmataceae bacterium]|nr:hypothetical protein [Gemmataceae bacterium]